MPKIQRNNIRKVVRKPRRTAVKVKSIDYRFIGDEPITVTEDNYVVALGWYGYTFDIDRGREFLLDYMKCAQHARSDMSFVRRCPKDRVIPTICWQARMMFNGNTLSDKSMEFFRSRLDQMIEYGREVREEKQEAAAAPERLTIQERTLIKNRMVYAQCENEILDEYRPVYNFLLQQEVTPSAANYILSQVQPLYDEVHSSDPEVTENYGNKLRQEKKYWQSVVDDIERYVGNKKVTKVRKPKAKKTKAAVDIVKNLKYQKEDATLKISSVNPAEIIGAQQLWAFNTKARKLIYFEAVGPAGLQVKGASIVGYDVDKSVIKRVRKSEETIKSVLGAGKVALRKVMNEINTTGFPTTGRINTDTILLRVVK